MGDEEWVKVAMADDSLVVDMLLRLHQAQPLLPPPPSPLHRSTTPSLQLEWTVRQRRSKSASRHVDSSGKKTEPASTRASPSTPLSWSGATSVSTNAAADGSEESSRPNKLKAASTSKIAVSNETLATKRSRRKKTLSELRDEENALLKERKMLKKELAALLVTVEKHRVSNKRLKRMKLDMQSQQAFQTATVTTSSEKTISEETRFRDRGQLFESVDSFVQSSVSCDPVDNNESDTHDRNVSPKAPRETSVALPDLNLPLEEDLDPRDVLKVS